jgi:transcriptional regulator with XRE-family HTH domain
MPCLKTDDIDKRIGINIRYHRQRRGLSLGALGEGVGVSFEQIRKYENGINRIAASRLALVAETLQVQISAFFSGTLIVELRPGFHTS